MRSLTIFSKITRQAKRGLPDGLVHSAQGQTCERVLIDADVSTATNSQIHFYVALSRATTEATLYTDERELLPEVVSRLDMKAAALDLPTEAVHALGERNTPF